MQKPCGSELHRQHPGFSFDQFQMNSAINVKCNNNCRHILRNIRRRKPALIMKKQCVRPEPLASNSDKQDENINPFIFQFPPLSPRLFTHKRLLQCCDNLYAVYVRPATENAARGLKAETAGSLTSLSGPGRYPDRKQLDAPLNTTLKNT